MVFNILARYYVMDATLEVGDSSSSQEEEKEPSSKKRYSCLFEMEAEFEPQKGLNYPVAMSKV